MRKIHQNVPVLFEPHAWRVVETEFSEERNKLNETIFTLANGYLGIRGFFEEGFYGRAEESDPSVMINGVYEYYPYRHIWCRPGFPSRFHSIVNNVNPVDVCVFLDGERVTLGKKVSEYSRTLDMYEGTVVRSFVYATAGGKKCRLVFTRFVSQTEKHLMAIKIGIFADAGTRIAIRSVLKAPEGASVSKKEEIGAEMNSPFTLISCGREGEESLVRYRTKQSLFKIACAAAEDCSLEKSGEKGGPDFVEEIFEGAADGKAEVVYKRYAAFASSADTEKYDSLALQTVEKAKREGFEALLEKSRAYWREYWKMSDIEIDGDPLIQQGIRFGLFMINQSAGRDGKTNISANGLTGTAYSGHTFWDTEIFMSPMFLYAHPEEVRQLLKYRYSILPKAKERAAQMDDVGALFSWNSINGEECGHVFEAATAQYHIDNDIFFSVYKYYEATLDWEFMEKFGIEILMETSKCLAHRGNFIERKGGKFCINCVCGPDEYNPVVDNNLYTNFLTRKQFYFTLEMLEKLEAENPETHSALLKKCEIDDGELALWKKAADNMYLPYDEKKEMYMQDDNFIYKDPIDVEAIPLDKLPLLTNLHPLNLWRYQVCKQADIVLLMFLCGDEFALEMRKKIFDFYEPKTIHDSSLSAGIHSIVACDVGYTDEAYGYLRQACRMDLDNVNRNTLFGIHAACMGSCYMMIVNGYAGMRIYGGKLHFKPYIPEKWKGYSFKIKFRGCVLEVKVSQTHTSYTLAEGESLGFHDKDEFVTLRARETLRVPLVK